MTASSTCHLPYIYRPVLFDLDGTITDSAPIITECFAATMETLTGVAEEPSYYRRFVGPPLPVSFAELGADDVERFVRVYRQFYRERMYDTPFFPGMRAFLFHLHAIGVPMVIATSKRRDVTELLLHHLGIDSVFLAICGSPAGDHGTKADRVAEGLAALRNEGISTERALMIGDRRFDIEGAGAHNIPTVLVGWGEGTAEERDHAWKVVHNLDELEQIIVA